MTMEMNLIGYLLQALDPLTQRQVEAYLAEHPEARARLELLRQALEPLAVDRDPGEAHPNLAERTLRFIAEAATRDAPQAPPHKRGPGSADSSWRRADVLVAAGLLLSFLSLLLPWVARLRALDRRHDNPVHLVECKDNLRQFYQALRVYHDQHGHFPNLEQIEAPRTAAGLMVPFLIDQGYLPASTNVHCPGAGGFGVCPWTLPQLQVMTPEEVEQSVQHLNPGYAYNLGYRDPNGSYVGFRLVPTKPNYLRPLMADCLGENSTKDNSANHDGTGQNVLFGDGHVKFKTSRFLFDDDIYLNKAKKVKAGLDMDDMVLGGSEDAP